MNKQMKQGHTPGPWRVEHVDEAWASYAVPTNKDAGYIAQCSYSVAGIEKEEAMANAALIAAAPELLEACKAYKAAYFDRADDAIELTEEARAIIAAIAKAEGRA